MAKRKSTAKRKHTKKIKVRKYRRRVPSGVEAAPFVFESTPFVEPIVTAPVVLVPVPIAKTKETMWQHVMKWLAS